MFHCSGSSHHCIFIQHLTNSHPPLFSSCFSLESTVISRWSRMIACLPYLQSLLERRWEIGGGGRIVPICASNSKIFRVTLIMSSCLYFVPSLFFNKYIILTSTSHTGTQFLKLHSLTQAWLPEAIFSTCIVWLLQGAKQFREATSPQRSECKGAVKEGRGGGGIEKGMNG